MKINIWKLAIFGTLCIISFTAYSAWRCEASNYNRQAWFAISNSESKAAKEALRTCQWNSRTSCYLNYCGHLNTSSYSYYGYVYQCNVADKRGHVWYGVAASSSKARAVAYSYCKGSSYSPRSCYVLSCFRRY